MYMYIYIYIYISAILSYLYILLCSNTFIIITTPCFVQQAGGNQLGLMVLAASSLIVALVVAFVASWKLCLAVLVFLPFLFAAGFAHGRDIKGSAERAMESADQGGKVGHRKWIFAHGVS